MTSANLPAAGESRNPWPPCRVLPLKNTVLFPYLFLPLSAGRPISLAAAEAALAGEDKTFLAVAQRNPQVEVPAADDLYTVGTRAVIKKMARSAGRDRAPGPGRGAGGAWSGWSRPSPICAPGSARCRCRTIRGRRSRPSAAPCST